ncbi:c-type cytochrome [Pannus brasiliensis]|uniref:c-type cytochrome n=1 Tax=Pannus brasiliensis TaxID=1579216 RepID=UPI003BEEFE6A
MNTQLVNPKISLSRLLLFISGALLAMGIIFLGFRLATISDPYVQEVLALPGNAGRGYEIFQINCAGCHGKFGDGSVGPSLHEVSRRKSKISLIEQVVSGKTPPMPKFQPDPQEMADLLIYLEHL